MSKKNLLVLMSTLASFPISVLPQNNELSLSIGRAFATTQQTTSASTLLCAVGVPGCNSVTTTNIGGGVAFLGNFTHRITNVGPAVFYLESPVLGGVARDATNTFRNGPLLGDVVFLSASSLFFTPSAKVKFLDASRVSPFATVGGGLAHLGLGGATRNTGALQFGGGADFKSPIRHLGFRAEVRDFFSPNTLQSSALVRVSPAHQHVIFAGGGAVLRF